MGLRDDGCGEFFPHLRDDQKQVLFIPPLRGQIRGDVEGTRPPIFSMGRPRDHYRWSSDGHRHHSSLKLAAPLYKQSRMNVLKKPQIVLYLLIWLLQTGHALASGQNPEPSPKPQLILAHYMPWYAARPFSNRWGWHWTMNHFDPERQTDGKREIASRFYPLIGPYDSGDPHVLEYHLLLMKLAGIDGVIVDWYGRTDFRDYAILHRNTTRLLQQCERLKMKFVICYEDQTIPALVEGRRISAADRVPHAVKEIDWLSRYWFKSGSYVKLNGQPVLLSFGHAGLTNDEWAQCLTRLESNVAYFSQDIRRAGALGGFGWPSPRVGLQQAERFLAASRKWPGAIPAAFPRFDDIYRQAGVSEGYPKLPDNNGRTLKETLEQAINSNAPIVQIATWNDWGEGTQIEPDRESRYRDLKIVQTVLHERKRTTFNEDDLLLPHRLLRIRPAGKSTELSDLTADSISAGRLKAARESLQQISQPD